MTGQAIRSSFLVVSVDWSHVHQEVEIPATAVENPKCFF